jgi:hypothetical protein
MEPNSAVKYRVSSAAKLVGTRASDRLQGRGQIMALDHSTATPQGLLGLTGGKQAVGESSASSLA